MGMKMYTENYYKALSGGATMDSWQPKYAWLTFPPPPCQKMQPATTRP